jgi:Macrocin-O-methyltransferase (TylF)
MSLTWYLDRFDVLSHAAAIAPVEGLVLEFGVASGDTIRWLARNPALRERRIHGFDSFKGLPEPWGCYPVSHFACAIPEVPKNVELLVGMFDETLTSFLDRHQDNVALLHIDCDLYSSTRTVLCYLSPRIVPGTVIVLDEFWIVTDQEQRAVNEWLAATGRSCRYEARSIEQLCVVMQD